MLGQKECKKWICICFTTITLIKRTVSSDPCPSNKKAAEKYVACESNATGYYKLDCYPEKLLGFEDPNYDISWTFNGAPMPWPYGSSFKTLNKSKLESMNSSPKDAGNYTCTVKSSNGTTVSRTINLCVTTSADFETKPFGFEIQPRDSKVMTGNNINFTCKAFVGNPSCLNPYNYTIYWWKVLNNGTKMLMESSSDVEIEDFLENGDIRSVLEFKHVLNQHYGTYECVVTNAYGEFRVNVTLEFGVNDSEYLALQYQAVIIILALCIFMPVAVCFCWRFRNVLALYYKEKTFDPTVADGYLYDVFVIHGETASRWIWEILQPNLEDIYKYKCFLPARDLVGGEDIIDAVSEKIPKCLRVIVVITPCLMRDHWSAWAIHHAYKAAMNTPTRILPLVLQNIKAKQYYSDPHGVLGILKILMAKRIRVPYACQLNETEANQGLEKKEEKPKSREDEIKTVDFKLKLPEEKNGSLRSRSKSPKNQRVMNMISASEERSKDIMEDYCGKRKTSLRGKEMEHDEERRVGNSPRGFKVNYEEEDEEPGSPCSITPFIFRKKYADQLKKEKFGTCIWQCIKVVFAGDEEQLFWQTMRLRLSPPLSRQLARINHKRSIEAKC